MEKQRIVHIFGCDFGEEVFYQSQIWETKPSSIIQIISSHIGAKSQRKNRVWKNLKTTKRSWNKSQRSVQGAKNSKT